MANTLGKTKKNLEDFVPKKYPLVLDTSIYFH